MTRSSLLLATLPLATLLSAPACFLASDPFQSPAPAEAPDLEARLAADSADMDAAVRLAVLHLLAGRAEEAQALLQRADGASPGDPAIRLLLAAADERLGAFVPAAMAYEGYRRTRTGSLATLAQERLVAIQPSVLRERARTIASAPRSDSLPMDPDLVAVLPLVRTASDASASAESAAISALVARGLAERGWRVVDDMLLRLVLEEMRVAPSALADVALGVEIGRRLGASRIVQGTARRVSLTSTEWDVTILTIEGPTSLRIEHVAIAAGPGATPAMQQRMSVLVRGVLERRQLAEPLGESATLSSVAFVSFGAGLLALDRGDAEAAREAFSEALMADPTFVDAAAMTSRAEVALRAPPLDSLIHEAARVGGLQRAVLALRSAPGSVHQAALARVGEGERALFTDVLGLDDLTGSVLLDVTFTLPGGIP